MTSPTRSFSDVSHGHELVFHVDWLEAEADDLTERAEYGIKERRSLPLEADEVAPWPFLDGHFLLDGLEDAFGVLV